MTDTAVREVRGDEIGCAWCGKAIGREAMNKGSQPVCERCYRLLTDAGLNDNEIFGDGPPTASTFDPASRPAPHESLDA